MFLQIGDYIVNNLIHGEVIGVSRDNSNLLKVLSSDGITYSILQCKNDFQKTKFRPGDRIRFVVYKFTDGDEHFRDHGIIDHIVFDGANIKYRMKRNLFERFMRDPPFFIPEYAAEFYPDTGGHLVSNTLEYIPQTFRNVFGGSS